ncbi:MAG: ribonuclease P Rpr2/Rpp21/SNM1 subunit [Thermoprotei archaeon]|nr:ribonuclease P Rpr2/Rpp21/SNM1 subunit [Thermoprotei archaeon]
MKKNKPRRLNRLKEKYRDLVKQRMSIAYRIAVDSVKKGDSEYAKKLGEYIREMSKRTRVRTPKPIKRSLCKNCNIPLIPGLTASIRVRSQSRKHRYIVVRCSACGYIHRYLYRKKVEEPGSSAQDKSMF